MSSEITHKKAQRRVYRDSITVTVTLGRVADLLMEFAMFLDLTQRVLVKKC